MRSTYSQPTPFLTLPAELRNRIYELVFPCEFGTHYRTDQRFWPRRSYCGCRGEALLQLSHQIRTETIPIFYGIHEFVFNAYNRAFLEAWLNHTAPEAVANLRRMKFYGYMQGLGQWDPALSYLTVDLRGSEPVVEWFAKGREPNAKDDELKDMLTSAIVEIVQGLERDWKGRHVLSKEKLGEIFDVFVTDEECEQPMAGSIE